VGPHPAVATVRRAVRRSITALDAGDLVLVACSGGPDSLALAAAVAFEAPRLGVRAGAVVIDHGLQPGSAQVTAKVAAVLTNLGLDPVLTSAVTVAGPADAVSYPGPEAAARVARYEALRAAAAATGATGVLLGHTLDDQAETVLLGLARGSGARSLAGMADRAGLYLRPLLDVRRAVTRAACEALGLQPWDDPQNCDPAFTRVRVRQDLIPALADALGPGVPEALARTARLLRADADALDALAAAEAERILADPTMVGPGDPSHAGSAPTMVGPGDPSHAGSAPTMAGPGDPSHAGSAPTMAGPGDLSHAGSAAAMGPAAAAVPGGPAEAGRGLAAGSATVAGPGGPGQAAVSPAAAARPAPIGPEWPVTALATLPAAIRRRILRAAALAAGCPARALAERHVASIDDLVTDWHGQRWTDLPGGIRCRRRYGKLLFTAERALPAPADAVASASCLPETDGPRASAAPASGPAPRTRPVPRSEDLLGRE
jgi:tRNA(Ile)-lysidine synthase